MAAIAAVVRNQGVRGWRQSPRFTHNKRPRWIGSCQEADRVAIESEAHVVRCNPQNTFRIPRQVGEERRITSAQQDSLVAQERTGWIWPLPYDGLLVRIIGTVKVS